MKKKIVSLIICGLIIFLFFTGCTKNSSNNETPQENNNLSPPHVNFIFSPANPGPNEFIQFTDSSVNNNDTIISWSWDFGDNSQSNEQNPKHLYSLEGNYSVNLTIKNNNNLSNSTTKTLKVILEVLSIITPYVNESDIDSVPEAYSLDDNNTYWGFRHPGIDFMTSKDLIQVRASTSGTISNINIAKESGQMGWHIGFCIQFNSYYSVSYNLESFTQSDDTEQKIRDNLFITDGQIVNQGDIIANMVYGGPGCHIDFGVCVPGNRICPEPFFTEEARESIMRLIQKNNPDWPICAD